MLVLGEAKTIFWQNFQQVGGLLFQSGKECEKLKILALVADYLTIFT